ncbi:MAG: glycosyltransferase family protein [Chloroflexi bacterium]|nr:glycosyltransferase family protein [Chloroflexota bacterium]
MNNTMGNDHPNSMKVIAIIQARMSASRLPGKVLLDIGGEPMLDRVVKRTRCSQIVDQVVVATSLDQSDNPIAEYCDHRGYISYRGSLHDVLDRYYQAAKSLSAGVVVRITADCPIIDPGVIDQTLNAFLGQGPSLITEADKDTEEKSQAQLEHKPAWDFAANRLPPPWQRTFPIGLDTEVCTFSALETAWREASQPHQREHVMPFLYEHENRFRVLLVNHDPDYGNFRWTVDTSRDLELLRTIYSRFGGRDDFSWLEVLELFGHEPELAEINAEVLHNDYREVEKGD